MMDPLLSVKEVAEYLGKKPQTIYNLVNTKQIPFHKIGRRSVRFDQAEIDIWAKVRKFNPAYNDEFIIFDGYPRINIAKEPKKGEFFNQKEIHQDAHMNYMQNLMKSMICDRQPRRFVDKAEDEINIIILSRIVIPSAIFNEKEIFTRSDSQNIADLITIADFAGLAYNGRIINTAQHDEFHYDQNGWIGTKEFYQKITIAVQQNVDQLSFDPANQKTDEEREYIKISISKRLVALLKEIGFSYAGVSGSTKNGWYYNKFQDFRQFLTAFFCGRISFFINNYADILLGVQHEKIIVKEMPLIGMAPEQINKCLLEKLLDTHETESALNAHINDLEMKIADLKKITKTLKRKK